MSAGLGGRGSRDLDAHDDFGAFGLSEVSEQVLARLGVVTIERGARNY